MLIIKFKKFLEQKKINKIELFREKFQANIKSLKKFEKVSRKFREKVSRKF